MPQEPFYTVPLPHPEPRNKMAFAFDLSDPKFASPALNAPRPCKHAANCYYSGPNGCAFVHPGEEGTAMKIFPPRTVKDQAGKEMWQKATVRLVGGAGFYERRRLKMSWPQWCALPKNSHLQPPVKPVFAEELPHETAVSSQTVAPSVMRMLFPTVGPSFVTASGLTVQRLVPAAGPQPVHVKFSELNVTDKWRAMFQRGYAVDTPEILAAREGFMSSLGPIDKAAIETLKREQMGNALYPVIQSVLAEEKEGLKEAGLWHDKITAGKITGMLLDGLDDAELQNLLVNKDELNRMITDACGVLLQAAEFSDACAAAAAARQATTA